ncbi:unnamed protein product, partial [Caenorhabditis auriculariae]
MPKGGASALIPVHAGVKDDMNVFLRTFIKKKTVLFAEFKELFVSCGMLAMFNGRSYGAEIIEFNERLLGICVEYMQPHVCSGLPRFFEERLFGLYALYIFYYLQPANFVVQARMDPDSVQDFTKLMQENLAPKQHWDAYACGLKLIHDNAFRIVAFPETHDISCFKNYEIISDEHEIAKVVNPNVPLSRFLNLVEGEEIQMLYTAHEIYEKSKLDTLGYVNLTYNYLDDPRSKIKTCVERVTQVHEYRTRELPSLRHKAYISNEVKQEQEKNNSEMAGENRNESEIARLATISEAAEPAGFRRSSIKEKAYSSNVTYSRNRRYLNMEATKEELTEGFGGDFSNNKERRENNQSVDEPKKNGTMGLKVKEELLETSQKRRGRKRKTIQFIDISETDPQEELSPCVLKKPGESRRTTNRVRFACEEEQSNYLEIEELKDVKPEDEREENN